MLVIGDTPSDHIINRHSDNKRLIKFRAIGCPKSLAGDKFIYGSLVEHDLLAIRGKGEQFSLTFVDSVGQNTGYVDIEGKEIYEGDIIKIGEDNLKYEVIYKNDGFCAKLMGETHQYIGIFPYLKYIKVIGDIYHDLVLAG